MEKIIELKSVELIDILGIGDANIKLIESNIPVSISARGEQLTIKGDSTGITEADAILKEMRETLSSKGALYKDCLLYTSPSPRDRQKSRMPSSA